MKFSILKIVNFVTFIYQNSYCGVGHVFNKDFFLSLEHLILRQLSIQKFHQNEPMYNT